MHFLRSLAQKGRLRTLSSSLESRKFNSQKIKQRNVRVRCIVSAPLLAYVYNISWRELLALLILWVRQCEGLRTGISDYRLPRLFISYKLISRIRGAIGVEKIKKWQRSILRHFTITRQCPASSRYWIAKH